VEIECIVEVADAPSRKKAVTSRRKPRGRR